MVLVYSKDEGSMLVGQPLYSNVSIFLTITEVMS